MDAEYENGFLRITRTERPPGLRLEGDVYDSSLPVLTEALEFAVRDGGGDVHVDLSRLQFIELGGLRTLVATASRLGADRALVLHALPPHVHRLIELIGWQHTPGLRIG